MRIEKRLNKARKRLAEIRQQQEYQMQFAGMRLGVFARLRELQRAYDRTASLIESLENWPSLDTAHPKEPPAR